MADDTPANKTTLAMTKEQAQIAYAIQLAWEVHLRNTRKYSRIKETAKLSRGECERIVEVTLRLPEQAAQQPTQDQAAGGASQPDSHSETLVPVWPMRKGQLLGDFQITSPSRRVRILSRHRSIALTRALLLQEWIKVRERLSAFTVVASESLSRWSTEVDRLLSTIATSDPQESRRASLDLVNLLKRDIASVIGQSSADDLPIEGLVAAAKFMGRRHMIWMATDASPGEVLTFEYRYTHRYSPEYSTNTSHRYPTYSTMKRFLGQTPSRYALAVSRFALARSYHFYMSAPAGCFFTEYGFAEMQGGRLDLDAFQDRAQLNGVDLLGRDETGGPTAHLYLYEMPLQPVHTQVFVAAKVMEAPPGSLAPASMIATASAVLAILALWRWDDISPSGLQPTIWGALAVVATLTGGWYSTVLGDRTRTIAPMATRLGLFGTATAMAISLFYFGALGLPSVDINRGLLRLLFALTVATPLAIVLVAVWTQRIWNYRAYRKRQLDAISRYGLQPRH